MTDELRFVGDWSRETSKKSGKKYYYNRILQKSQWNKPEEWVEFERQRSNARFDNQMPPVAMLDRNPSSQNQMQGGSNDMEYDNIDSRVGRGRSGDRSGGRSRGHTDTIDQTGGPRISSSHDTTPVSDESHPEQQRQQQGQHQVEDKKKPFKCNLCENSYKEDWLLTKHVAFVHEKQMPFKCNLCLATFAQGQILTNHKITVHKGKRSYKCCVCNQYFVEKQHLIVHNKRRHSGIKQGLIIKNSLEQEFLYS